KVHNIYPNSIYEKDKSILFITKHKGSKFLIILGKSQLLNEFKGRSFPSGQGKICDLTYDNSQILGKYFPFILPKSHKGYDTSIGLGDRLGLASIGHLKLIKDYKAFPVLAQQSIRELNLTDRTYKDVLASASWAVFQEGYTSGFGADGDHLKTAEEVAMALDLGFTMITLDCSDHIDNSIKDLGKDMVEAEYSKIDKKKRENLEDKYLNKSFSLTDDIEISFDESNFKRIILIYLKTIEFTEKIYRTLIKPLSRKVDFELSIDETSFTTSTEAHFLIGAELRDRKVEIASMAPRFPGEFQKGIDYIGDTEKFSRDFQLHHLIAEHFGYKISVHSGSDKFTVFPIIGEVTKGHYHLKTAGTNWLEALRVIALKDANLFRHIFQFALDNLEKARAYYHISGDP
ncbi:MAG TPA: tagaturonate epimerase family protein, partial [Tissierellaceae bacterium]|nr:tagaturonate epimerase family protein [Tissierellaceae bacterium]